MLIWVIKWFVRICSSLTLKDRTKDFMFIDFWDSCWEDIGWQSKLIMKFEFGGRGLNWKGGFLVLVFGGGVFLLGD